MAPTTYTFVGPLRPGDWQLDSFQFHGETIERGDEVDMEPWEFKQASRRFKLELGTGHTPDPIVNPLEEGLATDEQLLTTQQQLTALDAEVDANKALFDAHAADLVNHSSGREHAYAQGAGLTGQNSTTLIDYAGLVITINPIARPVAVEFHVSSVQVSLADTLVAFRLVDVTNGNANLGEVNVTPNLSFGVGQCRMRLRFGAGSGQRTIKVQHRRIAGTGTYGTNLGTPPYLEAVDR